MSIHNETLYIPDDFSWYGSYNTKETVKELFNHTLVQQLKSNLQPQSIRAIFVPHAGLNFSGLCSATAYHSIINQNYKRIILLCTDHYMGRGNYLPGFSTIESSEFGNFDIDNEFINELHKHTSLEIGDISIFNKEHSFLNQIPFLSLLSPRPKLIPIICGGDKNNTELSQYISSIIDNTTLLICTSDMSHVNGDFNEQIIGDDIYYRIRQNDSKVTQYLSNVNSNRNDSDLNKTSICGKEAIKLFIYILSILNTQSPLYPRLQCYYMSQQIDNNRISEFDEHVLLNNTIINDNQSCVSYASLIYSTESYINNNERRTMTKILTRYEQLQLLKYARDVIINHFEHKSDELLKPLHCNGNNIKRGLFVTIKERKNDKLRGCIGTLDITQDTIINNTKEYALLTAFDDPRFTPMTYEEVKSNKYIYSISLLAKLKEITLSDYLSNNSVFHLGEDGLNLTLPDGKSAYFLPSVSVEYNLNKKQLLNHLCRKIEQNEDCYTKGKLMYNEGVEFGEEPL